MNPANNCSVWQGGNLPVPWARLQTDGETGQYCLIQQHRLPDSVKCLRSPGRFSEKETWAWAHSLRSPERTGLFLFQFRQVRPGQVEEETRTIMHPKSRIHYGPKSLLYMRRRMMEHGLELDQWEGLPPMPAQVPVMWTDESRAWAQEAAVGEPVFSVLLDYLTAYEDFGPYQATRADWERFRDGCLLLKRDLPDPTAGVEHLVYQTDSNGEQLPREMFDANLPNSAAWSPGEIVSWIEGQAFVHRSGTLIAGPYGVKWAFLVLLLLFVCGEKIEEGRGPRYRNVEVSWSKARTKEVVDCANRLMARIGELVAQLVQSQAAREAARITDGLDEPVGPSWDEEDIIESSMIKPQDEWTRHDMVVTRFPTGARVAPTLSRNATRTASQKRSRETLNASDDSVTGADDDAAPRKGGKRAKGKQVQNANETEVVNWPQRKGKGVSFE
ncbi:hypothetical protein FRC10_005490 [Ceratobasidium sp. 414]|nr:hypothetical protein FRC10_005490 [Ceratobasidium sp. 414]